MRSSVPTKSWEMALAEPHAPLLDCEHHQAAAQAVLMPLDTRRPILKDDHRASGSAASPRRKIWELDGSLHCSVIGTCLTGGELRALIGKFHAPLADKPTDHALHTIAVSTAAQHNLLAKQIQKSLDRRHAASIRRFGEAKNVDQLKQLWHEARQAGDIPGVYWAILSHPRTTDALVREVFGDVHMLSHLVGAANRADIRRLHELEEEKTTLEEKLVRQQAQLRDGIVSRDAKINELNAALGARIERRSHPSESGATVSGEESEIATLHTLVVDLRKLPDREVLRRAKAEKRVEELSIAKAKHDRALLALEDEAAALRSELEAVEARLAAAHDTEAETDNFDLGGVTILYVGGRPQQVARLRSLIESASGQLLHHDGGIEERADLLPGLVSRADAAFFPVDCISHSAALLLKRLCQQAAKPYVPLRNASFAAMLRALHTSNWSAVNAARTAAE